MIQQVNDEWGKVEQALSQRGNMADEQELSDLLKSIAGVRATLKRMCDVSVTRKTLHEAVREALIPVLREHGRELIPELFAEGGGARAHAVAADSAGLPSPIASRLADFEKRIQRLSELDTELDGVRGQVGDVRDQVGGVEARLGQAETELGGLKESLRSFEERLEALDTKHGGDLGELRETLEGQLRAGLLAVEEKIEGAKTQISEFVTRMEASVPETVDQKTAELETRLRKEVDDMVNGLEEKLAGLREMLVRMENLLPRREVVESVDARLGRLETQFENVSSRVENIDAVTPEIRALQERFGDLRTQLSSISGDLNSTGRDVGDLRHSIGGSLSELRSVLDSGIKRWEADQSQTLERLSAVRDTLRDQFQQFSAQVEGQGKSLWGKITRKGEGGLKLTREEWDQLAGKIEGIISGLETVLAKRKDS